MVSSVRFCAQNYEGLMDQFQERDIFKLHQNAAEGNHKECMRLISEGADVDSRDQLGWTPLMHSVMGSHWCLANDLLSQGADASIQNNHGVTAFTLSVLGCEEHMLVTLYERLTSPELKQSESDQALQVVCVHGLYAAAKWLLKRTTADVNCVSPVTGVTPLFLAVIGCHYKLVKLLLWSGADPSIPSALGESVFQIARDSKHRTLLHALQSDSSPTRLDCLDFNISVPAVNNTIDFKYTSNDMHLNLDSDVVLKNSPRRPVFKTGDNDLDSGSITDHPMLSPSLSSVFTPSPHLSYSRSWNDSELHYEMDKSLDLQKSKSLLPTTKIHLSLSERGQKRKLSEKSGSSSWLRRLTKRRHRSLDCDADYCTDHDTSKQHGIDFSQLLLGLGLDDYFTIFKEQELDIWTLLTLTSDDLNAMGINDDICQKHILKSIEQLRKIQL